MKIPCVEGEALPVGDYVGRFLGVEEQDAESWEKAQYKGKDGTVLPRGIVWRWEVVEGPHSGRVADRLTPAVATKGNNTTVFAEIITGGRFAVGAEFDPDKFIGTLWRFRIDAKDTGKGTYVSTRGLARALDLEKGRDDVPRFDGKLDETGGPVIWAKLPGHPRPTCFTIAGLQRAVKMLTVKLDVPAAWAGETSWRTATDVLQDVTAGRTPQMTNAS